MTINKPEEISALLQSSNGKYQEERGEIFDIRCTLINRYL